MLRTILMALLGAVLAVSAYLFYHYQTMQTWMNTPLNSDETPVVVSIEPGQSVRGALRQLIVAGLVKDEPYTAYLGKVGPPVAPVQTGEYELNSSMSPLEMLNVMAQGKVKLYSVTVPEGLRWKAVFQRFVLAGFGKLDDYQARTPGKTLEMEFDLPSIEGYLFPETYSIPRGTKPYKIITLLVEAFNRHFTPDMEAAAKKRGYSRHQAVIMASIIQKECGDEREFPLVSSVIHNRLKRGMPLQMDPTVLYGLDTKDLTRKDLQTDHPWNTYTRKGLPATPICNPGLAALQAAVNPADTNYLYFVSMNNGRHKFTSTLKDHNAAVRKYQLRREVGP